MSPLNVALLITELLVLVFLLLRRDQLKKEFLKEMALGKGTLIHDPISQERSVLWKQKKHLQLPNSQSYYALMKALYPFWLEYYNARKTEKAIRIEKEVNAMGVILLLLFFVLFITLLIALDS